MYEKRETSSSAFVPSSGSLEGGLASRPLPFGHFFASFFLPAARREKSLSSLDIGSLLAIPLPLPVARHPRCKSATGRSREVVSYRERRERSRNGNADWSATSFCVDPAVLSYTGTHIYTCVYACSYISTRAYTRDITHARPLRGDAPRVANRALSHPLTRTHARTHARIHATHMGALGRRQ